MKFRIPFVIVWTTFSAQADTLFTEDFTGGDGGFVSTEVGGSTFPWTFNEPSSSWRLDGDNNLGFPTRNNLTSPSIDITGTEVLVISFDHRYSIEGGLWDGGALFTSLNGGAFVQVPTTAFIENGYTAIGLIGNHDLFEGSGFGGNSPGYVDGTFITSVAQIPGLAIGDTIQLQFVGAYDEFSRGAFLPNWEIDSVTVETLVDSDGDGMPNNYELANGLNPDVDDADEDLDTDNVSNFTEFENGTDPQEEDTDMDGLNDGVETNTGTWVSATDTGTNPLNSDSDNDGLLDGVENPDLPFVDADQTGTDPNNSDSDDDTISDGTEIDQGRDPSVAQPLPPGYFQDFDGFADGTTDLGDGSVMNGTTAVEGDQLVLTRDGVAGGFASFMIPADAVPGSEDGWTATFDLTISDGPGANEPADGLSFNYGNFALTELGSAEEGMGAAADVTENISFEIDTWMNLDAEQGVNIAEKVGGGDTDLSFTGGSILADGTSVSGLVVCTYDPVDGLSFTTEGLLTNALFENIAASFLGDDAYNFGISARVGGANQTVAIDNLRISSSSSQQDRLRIISIEKVDGDVTLIWTSSDRRTYGVYTSADLQGEWQELDDSVPGAAGMTTTSYTHAGVPNGVLRQFYQIRETSP